MKTAISIPDDVFEQADRRAAELRISRSELYSTAVRRFLDAELEVTEQLNRVYAELKGLPDAFLESAARATSATSEWE